MNAAYIHLLLNHLPLYLVAAAIVTLVLAVVRRSRTVLAVGLWLLVFAGASSVAVLVSGNAAEELVEGLGGISHQVIEHHEELAKEATLVCLLSAGGAVGLLLSRKTIPDRARWYAAMVLTAISIGAVVMIAQAAHEGGMIRHAEEIQQWVVPHSSDKEQ